ncbi:MAG TPA: Fur family transcriptional regulator [Sulfurimonas sp. UBA12504]|nr:MAG: Fur family transcriptional regulator [Sulfurimonas sp. GWF2_37_8]DAB29501.1 MAG TPA: Fur family transcriptional regulator [Sulfurimonas sp. UBA12504]
MQIEKIIEEKNLKLTTARKELLEIFVVSSKPLCFEDVKSKLSMDKATFYRNVSKFEAETILNSFESNDKKRYYEINESAHAHFVCKRCNKIECLKEKLTYELRGYIIEDMILKGVCKQCKQMSL